MAELADAQDLESCGRPSRFDSCYPHHINKKAPYTVLFCLRCRRQRNLKPEVRSLAVDGNPFVLTDISPIRGISCYPKKSNRGSWFLPRGSPFRGFGKFLLSAPKKERFCNRSFFTYFAFLQNIHNALCKSVHHATC